jgi:putative MATE family efflux protein
MTPPPTQRALPAGPLWRSMLLFLLPMLASNILQALSGTVNAIYLGRMIGVDALAAVSSFFPFVFFMISFVIGLSNGATVLIGQAIGAREPAKAKAVAGTALAVIGAFGLTVAVAGGLFADAVLRGVGTPPNILGYATEYARVMFVAVPILFVFLAYTTFLRGTGDSRTPFRALVLATAVSLALTPAFITGWAGLPRLGVASGAWATAIANLVALGWLLRHLHRVRSPVAFDAVLLRHLAIDTRILLPLLRIGLPTGLQLVMVSLSEIAVIAFVNGFGSEATAAYGAVNQVVSYVQFPAISVGITASIFGAQAIGAGRPEDLRRIARTAIELMLVLVGTLVALAYVFSRDLVGWFIADPHTVEIAHELMSLTLWSYLVFGSTAVLSAVMRSSGTVLWPTTLSILSIWCIQVPTAWLLSRAIGLQGVWIAYPVSFLCSLALQTAYYKLVWRRMRHVRLI